MININVIIIIIKYFILISTNFVCLNRFIQNPMYPGPQTSVVGWRPFLRVRQITLRTNRQEPLTRRDVIDGDPARILTEVIDVTQSDFI